MPGTFAHIALANEAIKKIVESPLAGELQLAILENQEFAFLGANAPDFPYPANQFKWADRMHYERSASIIKNAWKALKELELNKNENFAKCFAWFLGYLSHMVGDATIHPVVNLIAGPYNKSIKNQKKHRLCETYQDCYIFRQRMNQLELKDAEFIQSVLQNCRAPQNAYQIAPGVKELWEMMLKEAFDDSADLNPDTWFLFYVQLVDKVTEEGGKTSSIAANIFDMKELVQVGHENLEMSFISNLPAPHDIRIEYDALFDKALGNIACLWQTFCISFTEGKEPPSILDSDWN